jgi:serine/threonine protein kinase
MSDADLPVRFARYRVEKRLGVGGMGTVFRARDTKLDRLVALKVPCFTEADGPEIRERFLREAKAAASVDHANICRVYDAGEVAGELYLTMEYVEGRPLSDLIKLGKRWPQLPVAAMIRRLATALQEVHDRGVIHRDIKSANIMVDAKNRPIVMDFGIARTAGTAEGGLTEEGSLLGTPAYMPPEQVAGELAKIGPRSDVYSLGVVLYEVLTGRTPFRGALGQVFSAVLHEVPAPPSQLRPDLDPELEAACLKAMSKRPEDRFASMSEFAEALSAYLNRDSAGGPGLPPPSPAEPARTPEAGADLRERDDHVTDLLADLVAQLKTVDRGQGGARRHPLLWGLGIGAAILPVIAFLGPLNRGRTDRNPAGDPSRLAITVILQLPKGVPSDATVLIDGQRHTPEQLQRPVAMTPGPHVVVVMLGSDELVRTTTTVPKVAPTDPVDVAIPGTQGFARPVKVPLPSEAASDWEVSIDGVLIAAGQLHGLISLTLGAHEVIIRKGGTILFEPIRMIVLQDGLVIRQGDYVAYEQHSGAETTRDGIQFLSPLAAGDGRLIVKDAPGFPKIVGLLVIPGAADTSATRSYGGAGPVVVPAGRYNVSCAFEGCFDSIVIASDLAVPAGASVPLPIAERAGAIVVKDAPGLPKVSSVFAGTANPDRAVQRRYGGAGPVVVPAGRYNVSCEFEGRFGPESVRSGLEVKAGQSVEVSK